MLLTQPSATDASVMFSKLGSGVNHPFSIMLRENIHDQIGLTIGAVVQVTVQLGLDTDPAKVDNLFVGHKAWLGLGCEGP